MSSEADARAEMIERARLFNIESRGRAHGGFMGGDRLLVLEADFALSELATRDAKIAELEREVERLRACLPPFVHNIPAHVLTDEAAKVDIRAWAYVSRITDQGWTSSTPPAPAPPAAPCSHGSHEWKIGTGDMAGTTWCLRCGVHEKLPAPAPPDAGDVFEAFANDWWPNKTDLIAQSKRPFDVHISRGGLRDFARARFGELLEFVEKVAEHGHGTGLQILAHGLLARLRSATAETKEGGK